MNIFTIIGIVGIGMVTFTALFALMISRLDAAVVQSKVDVEAGKKQFRPASTFGFKISQDEDSAVQFRDARHEAARQAVKLPRGANMRIGRKGAETLQTASENLKNDPVSAFKISETQGWGGLGEFAKLQTAASGAVAAPVAAAGATKTVKRKLIAGKDYEAVVVTASMSGLEKRAARIANGKAKYAAYKVLKESGQDMVVTTAAPVAAAVVSAGPSAAEAASAAGIEEPVYIEITDDMDPAAKKTAKLSNIKAKNTYKKALKAAGVSASVPAAAAAPIVEAAPAVPVTEAAPAGLSDIPLPDLIEITDDMDAAAKKNAKLSNIKARSAYKKALKAAGIDPKSVSI
ncbi:MAG: hypothetical protein ACI85U_002286 [Candidatus Promineifilaceae bacterium]|jgi:hypothetical protein